MNGEQLSTGFDSAAIVKNCNELARTQDAGMEALVSLSSSLSVCRPFSAGVSLSISATAGFTNLHETDADLSKCHSFCVCVCESLKAEQVQTHTAGGVSGLHAAASPLVPNESAAVGLTGVWGYGGPTFVQVCVRTGPAEVNYEVWHSSCELWF